jgi:DNA polymerase II large subunit
MIYEDVLKEKLENEVEIASEARKKGFDPALHPEIHITQDLAERVQAITEIEGIGARIKELEKKGYNREEIVLKVGHDFVDGRFGRYKNKKADVVENAVRATVAILTEGVVAAPIDGISRVELGRNDDFSEYIKIFYSGPIRSAGGTAQALSVLIADYVRREMGFAAYLAREEEISRYIAEISAYTRITGLQYTPSDDEIRLIVKNCPICIDGDATEDMEVEGHKDLARVATNKIRGGMVLVLTEGIAMKAAKIKRYVERFEIGGWEWLDALVVSKEEDRKRDFLDDLIAGRPVFGKSGRKGSFRLIYGRARNSGFAAVGINPATLALLQFLASGTQIKLELPGKAGCVVPVDSIEAAVVKLKNGSLVRLNSVNDIFRWGGSEEVEEIVDLGEILVDYGDFLENDHVLVPGAYSHPWWLCELEDKSKEEADKWRKKKPSQDIAIKIASQYEIPLHPAYTYLWEDVTEEDKEYLAGYICEKGSLTAGKKSLFIPHDDEKISSILEDLLVQTFKKFNQNASLLVIEEPNALLRCLGINEALKRDESVRIRTRGKAPTRLAVRMGRPEKSKERKMTPAPHSLFPVGKYGGKNRSLKEALKNKVIEVEIGMRKCRECGTEFLASFSICDACGVPVQNKNKNITNQDKAWGKNRYRGVDKNKKKSVNLEEYYQQTVKKLGLNEPKKERERDVKCVQGLISRQKVAEHLGKGILRSYHNVFVFKDGTIRYDLTNLPLTHFKPKEIGLSVERAKEQGYFHDKDGKELDDSEQIVELKQQDIIISEDAASYLLRISQFLDSLLERLYGLPTYYGVSSREDLIGELVLGIAPHTSAGVLGRIIGFTKASACYAHPFFHAAKRRNADGDEDAIVLLLDALLNFSLSFLPDKKGGKMDAPLVLIPFINPKEVDKEAHNVSIASEYPQDFYEATLLRKHPKEVVEKIETAVSRIEEPMDVYGVGYTHETTDIAAGPLNSIYKTLKTMKEKMESQLTLARKIRAVDEKEVAELVIKNHFLRDIKGNLRAFATQNVRCSKCNAKYRRVPLSGKCWKCGSKLMPTVYAAGVKKYVDVSWRIANDFCVSDYTKQRLELIKQEVDSLFPVDEKQKSLSDFL